MKIYTPPDTAARRSDTISNLTPKLAAVLERIRAEDGGALDAEASQQKTAIEKSMEALPAETRAEAHIMLALAVGHAECIRDGADVEELGDRLMNALHSAFSYFYVTGLASTNDPVLTYYAASFANRFLKGKDVSAPIHSKEPLGLEDTIRSILNARKNLLFLATSELFGGDEQSALICVHDQLEQHGDRLHDLFQQGQIMEAG